MPQSLVKLAPKLQKIVSSRKRTPDWLQKFQRTRQNALSRWRKPDTPFYVGQKQIFLPDFSIALLRTPHNPPTAATFRVPLWFNKLDIRDYLFHAYNVRIRTVRSFLKYISIRPPAFGSQRALRGKRKQYLPRPVKRMTVEMEKPFAWPEEPRGEALEQWDKTRFSEMRRQAVKAKEERLGRRLNERERASFQDEEPAAQAESWRSNLRYNAERMLRGEVKWKTDRPIYDWNFGAPLNQDGARGSQSRL